MGVVIGGEAGCICFTKHTYLERIAALPAVFPSAKALRMFRTPEGTSIEDILRIAHRVRLSDIGVRAPFSTLPTLFENGFRFGLTRNALIESEHLGFGFLIGYFWAKHYIQRFAPTHRLARTLRDRPQERRGGPGMVLALDAARRTRTLA